MHKYCYVNGKVAELAKARLAPNDLGLLRGYAVFDFLRTENGIPFLFDEHFARLERSARTLGLKVPINKTKCFSVLKQLLKKNKLKDASFRLVLTGGPTKDGVSLGKPSFFILVEDIYNLPSKISTEGGKLITYEHHRQFPEAKTTNYLTAISLQKEKKKAGAVEMLYLSKGKVLEATTSNIFIIKANTLVTPKDNVLLGTTRALVIKLAKKAGFSVEERDLFVGELVEAGEVFITSTNKKITPIVAIDNMLIGDGEVGEKTKVLMEEFKELIAK